MIKGKSVNLTAVCKEDLPSLMAWRNNPDFRKNFREYRELNQEMQLGWFEKTVCNDRSTLMFAIRDSKTDELLGCCGLCYINWVYRTGEMSIYIGKDNLYIDDKYAVEALELLSRYGFYELALNKIWTEIYEFDSMKDRLLRSFGYKLDGTLRENYFYDNKWWNSLIYSQLKSDYANRK